MKSKAVTNLHSRREVQGMLFLLDRQHSVDFDTNVGIITDEGVQLSVKSDAPWRTTLMNHLWDQVYIFGNVDYREKTIEVISLRPRGDVQDFDNDLPEMSNDTRELEYYDRIIRNGDLISVMA